jgi:hypothetical protein
MLSTVEILTCGIQSLPPSLRGAWECCGPREEGEFTWDLTRNPNLEWVGDFWPQYRFDRLYVPGKHAAAQRFSLVGLEKVAGTQSYPSDHWGLLVKLSLDLLLRQLWVLLGTSFSRSSGKAKTISILTAPVILIGL